MTHRREFIKKTLLWGKYALGATAIAYPVFSFIGFRKITRKKIIFSQADQQAISSFKSGAHLVTTPDGMKAFSANCPHLGCILNFNAVADQFQCPCHGSIFDRSGKWISGPAQKNLQELPVKIKPNGDIETILKI